MSTAPFPISPDLLEILRDPYAIQQGDVYGPDPGQLTLVHDCWLVSADTGYKYPIRDGIPVMLVEEGARWKDTPVEDLPVPPPAPPAVPGESAAVAPAEPGNTFNYAVLAIVGGILLIGGLIGLSRLLSRRNSSDAQ